LASPGFGDFVIKKLIHIYTKQGTTEQQSAISNQQSAISSNESYGICVITKWEIH
jgi:hypothetical protein